MAKLRGLRDSAPPRFLAILGASGAGKSSFLRAGLPQLTQQLLQDLDKSGGKDALPLLDFTLERLYRDNGDDGDLCLEEYRRMGGVQGAIEAAVENALKEAMTDPKVPRDKKAHQIAQSLADH